MSEHAGAVATMTVQDEAGGSVRLDELWRERTALIALVRHFG